MWYKVKRILIYPDGATEKQAYHAIRVQTFDFQNDGDLGWTNHSVGSWDCSIASWQWWQITRSWYNIMQWNVSPSSSIFWWVLKKYKIRWYKSWNWCFWIVDYWNTNSLEYGRDTTKLSVNWTTVANITLNWEIIMEIIFEDNWHITVNLENNWNTYTYDVWAYWTQFQTYWNNKQLDLILWRWNNNNPVYVRKVEITTQP